MIRIDAPVTFVVPVVLVVLAAVSVPRSVQAQTSDSVQLVHAARRDVARYERELIVVPATLATQPRQPSERERATRALRLRTELIARLDSAAARLPGDDWITGQRVGLRIQQGEYAGAAGTAAACRATPWWCSALLGFALHVGDRIVEAEAAFDTALAGMPADTRCNWAAAAAVLLDQPLRSRYANATCSARDSMQARIWWLANPLMLRPGNDRKTEHYARLVAMQLHHMRLQRPGDYAPNDFSMTECHDHHAPLLRGGWPDTWWERGSFRPPAGGYGFVPATDALLDPLAADESAFDVLSGTRRERYAPTYGSVSALLYQTAFFARGDSLLVVTATPRPADALPAGVALTRSEREAPVLLEADTAQTTALRLTGRVPAGAWLVSVESLRHDGGARRARFARRLPDPTPDGSALSDLLLFAWQEHTAETLDAVLPHMLASTALDRRQRAGIFWEMYSTGRPRELHVSLSVAPLRPGLLRRAAEALRLRASRRRVTLQWEAGPVTQRIGRAIELDISQLRPGPHVLRIELRDASGSAAAERIIEIR